MRDGIRSEFGSERGEVLQQESGQVTVFTERQQILLVQSVDIGFRVLLDNSIGDDDWSTLVSSSDSVHRETTGQTSDRAEQTLESLGQVVRNVVLVDL